MSLSIEKDKFHIHGQPTYKGRTWNGKPVEGLLMNSRMVRATFDDRNPIKHYGDLDLEMSRKKLDQVGPIKQLMA